MIVYKLDGEVVLKVIDAAVPQVGDPVTTIFKTFMNGIPIGTNIDAVVTEVRVEAEQTVVEIAYRT